MPGATQDLEARRARPELELLLQACRNQPSDRDCARIESLASRALDWPFLVRVARRHGVAPLLFAALDSTCPGAIPAAVSRELKDHFLANAVRGQEMARELGGIVERLEARAVEALALKGPVLAQTAYGSPAARQAQDLDILVLARDVPRALETLGDAGYRILLPGADWDHAIALRREGALAHLDLHRALLRARSGAEIPVDEVWDRSRRVSLEGKGIRALSPEDELLYLCAHATKHCWTNLKWVCDVGEVIRSAPDLDWETLSHRAARWSTRRSFHLGVLLAHDLLEVPIPADLLRSARADRITRICASRASRSMFDEEGALENPLLRHSFGLAVCVGAGARLRYLAGVLRDVVTLNPADRDAVILPRSLRFVYYGLRPLRLCFAYLIRPVFGRVARSPDRRRRASGDALTDPAVDALHGLGRFRKETAEADAAST